MFTDLRRLGRFSIRADVVNGDTELTLAHLKGMVILRAEARLDLDVIEYSAHSEYFDEISLGMMVPEYEFIIVSAPGQAYAGQWHPMRRLN